MDQNPLFDSDFDTEFYMDETEEVIDGVVNYDYEQHFSLDYYEVDDYIYEAVSDGASYVFSDPDYYDFYTDYLAADEYNGDYYYYDETIYTNEDNFYNYYYGDYIDYE